jgi:hypothetical protein
MPHQLVPRAAALATALLLLTAAVAFADTISGDADLVADGAQGTHDLGVVGPGAVITVPVSFVLKCAGIRHVDPGQTVTLSLSSVGEPEGGSVTATDGVIGPVPPTWGDDTHGISGCPTPTPDPISASTPSMATIHAPMTPGGPYTYSLMYDRALFPAGVSDSTSITSAVIAASFTLTVVSNTAPVLSLPSDFSREGDTHGGWTADYPGVSASDAEDDPDPTPSCSPAPGSVLPLGTTTVACSVTDGGGLSASGTFKVTVVDTTAPVLHGMPSDIEVGTMSASGAVVSWSGPTATDIVDASPYVGCLPASGSTFAVGNTTVNCTATDHSGNPAHASFQVTVDLFGARFDEPIGPTKEIDVNLGRVVPVKVQLWRNGVEVAQPTAGALLQITECDSASTVRTYDLAWQPSARRWTARLDTSGLSDGCYHGSILVDGQPAGSFKLVVTGSSPSPASIRARSAGALTSSPPKDAKKPH